MPQFDDFLKPESMVTPGVAGGMTMLITNTLCHQFTLQPKWTALIISFTIGLVVFISSKVPIWQRLVYYTINSLIIFSMATGANQIGVATTNTADTASIIRTVGAVASYSLPVSEAWADTEEATAPHALTEKEKELAHREEEIRKREQELEDRLMLLEEKEAGFSETRSFHVPPKNSADEDKPEKKPFFKEW